MYTKISDPSMEIYNGETNEFIGVAEFDLSTNAEYDLLNLVNYGKLPESLLIFNLSLHQPDKSYVPPTPYVEHLRKGTIIALFTDSFAGKQIPIEIKINYIARANSVYFGDYNSYPSVIYTNIVVESVIENHQ